MVTRSILRPVLRPVTRAVSDTIRGFNPRSLFAAGEQGIWLDPSDFSTLFQDAAGTTPVTAVGQPVGLALDKSGRGNHASQTTSASRPTVEARTNLATNSEGAVATWTPTLNVTNAVTSIAGFSASIAFGDNSVDRYAYKTVSTVAATHYTLSVFVQMDDGLAPVVGTNQNLGDFCLVIEGEVANLNATVKHIAGSLYRVSAGRVTTAPINANNGVLKFTTQSARTFRVIGIQLELGSATTTYQSVNTATDYADVGAPRYLSFDGTDDGMATPSIDFTGTDKMTVWAGVRKLSDAVVGAVVELSAAIGSNNGAFSFFAPTSTAPNAQYGSKGTTASFATPSGLTSPLTFVMCGQSNIAAPSVSARINGVVASSNAFSQGTGKYGNYPLYIGRRGGTSFPFNGRIYQLIIRGAASNAGQIAATEAWCNSKTRAY